MIKQTKGFTLIELLVSVVIFLSVITMVTLIYKGAFTSSEKATQYVKMNTALPEILDTVRRDIRTYNFTDTSIQGQGQNGGVQYSYTATSIETKQVMNFASRSEFNRLPKRGNAYRLWSIELNIELKGLKRQYQLSEVSWRDR